MSTFKVSSWIGSNPEHIVNMLKYCISPDIYIPHIERGGTLLQLLEILGIDSNSEESVEESEREEEELVPVKIEHEEDELQEEEEEKEPENGDSGDNDVHKVLVPVKIELEEEELQEEEETVETNKSVNEGVTEEWDPKYDIDFYVQLFTSDGGLKEAGFTEIGRQKSASSFREKGKLCVEYQNKKGEVNEKEQEEENNDEEEGEEEGNDNEGEEEVEEEGEELQEEDDNDVHNLELVPVNIEHEQNTENEKHKSNDEKLHPVETVETSKSLDERETEDWDPQNDIDASVELFTPDDGSKEGDVKQSGRQKSASSIRKKEKRFRITRRCEICSASINDMSKHLERTHKLLKKERQKYLLAARGRVPIRRRAMIENPSTGRNQRKREDCPLCQGKNYTSLQNHLKSKHGLEASEAKEIRKQFRITRRSEICSASADDMSKHLARTHKPSKEAWQKHYTSLLNPLKSKHGLETNEAKEIRKRTSKDEKLHPVETVEKSKSLDERETEELDPKNDIDASEELVTSDGVSKEADGKQSGRQNSASSIRKKGKGFRITRRCEICSTSTNEMSKHLARTHKLAKEERQKYLLAARGRVPIRRRAMIENPSSGRKQSKRENCPLCEGKHYTSLQNHFKTKHGLEANEAKEIRKRMKQGVELDEAYQLRTDAAASEVEECEREEDMRDHQESLEDAGMNEKQRQTEEESDEEDNEDDEGDEKDEDWVPQRDWKNARQQEWGRTNVEEENKKEEENEKNEEDEEDDDQEEDDTKEEKEPESVAIDVDRVLVPVNIEHEQNTENEKHKSNDEKLHPVETVETSKSLDERETEDWDPQHDIDASVELFTPDGGSKEADVKQSDRQNSVSSIRKKEKRFRITRRCEICSASTNDMSKHLGRTHKLAKEERQKYLLAARGRVPIRRRAMIENPSSGRNQTKREDCPLCQGKNYTSLQNHLKSKHGLEANEAKEIRKQFRITRRGEICSASADDMSKHLATTHQPSKEASQKHYTPLLNPLRSKHGLETNEAKEIRKRTSKDEKLHPVETLETSKSLDERETEELGPQNYIDAPVELVTSDGGSKEADGKQSGRQNSASSIRKKAKQFRITRRCEICSASTNDMSKHLARTHKLSKEERQKYILAARGRVPIRRRAMIENPSSGRKQSKRENCPLCEGKHYTSLQNHLQSKHGLEANEAKEIRKRMKQGFVKQGPGVELDEAHQLGTDAADSETNDLLSRYRSFINLACDTTYGESSSTQHCRQLKKMCEMAFSKLLKGSLTPRINDDVVASKECCRKKEREQSNSQMDAVKDDAVTSGECSKQTEIERSNSQLDAVKDVPGEGACRSVEERPTKRRRKLLDSEEEEILRTEVQRAVNNPRRKGLHFREIIAEAYSNSQLKNVLVVQQYYDKARYMGLLK